jgi:hypothetical protein
MALYGVLIFGFVGFLWWYNQQRQTRLDADPQQRRLAELLTKAATGRGATRHDVSEQLDRISKNSADRRVRLTHAVMLTRSEAAPDLYDKVLALSRQLP